MRWLKWSLAAVLAIAGCKEPNNVIPPDSAVVTADAGAPASSPASARAAATEPAAGPSTQAHDMDDVALTAEDLAPSGAVMAVVNGKPIAMKTLHEILVRDQGMSVAYQLIADELVRQEALGRQISVSKDEVQKETEAVMKRALGELPAADQREKVLEELMTRLGVSPGMWDMLMRRQALLRKLVDPEVRVTDEELKDEFGAQYDRKVTVRDIQVAAVGDAEKVLKAIQAQGDKLSEEFFADQARKVSTGVTASTGGLLSPITAKSLYPPALRDAALRFKKPLETSGIIQCGTTFHILMASKIEDPQNVKFEEVKPRLVAAVRERHVAELQQQHLGQLIKDARKKGKIEFIDATLKAQDAQPPVEK